MSPEMIAREGHNKMVDIYGLGALLYEMLFGFPPHYSQNESEIFYGIMNKPLEFPKTRPISYEL